MEDSPSSRLDEFEREAQRMGIKGGRAEPERWLVIAGVVLVVVGVALAAAAWASSNATNNVLNQNDDIIMAMTGLLSGIIGVVLWARYSLSRYYRYWLVRLIYEDRQQADRIVDALAHLERQLSTTKEPTSGV